MLIVSFCAQHQFLNSWFQICSSCLTYENGSDPFIYFWLQWAFVVTHWLFVGVCGLSLIVTSWGYSLVAIYRTLIAVASLVEHRLQSVWGSVVASHRLWNACSVVVAMGLFAPWHVRSSRTRDSIHVPCIDRKILNRWTTREVPVPILLNDFSLPTER